MKYKVFLLMLLGYVPLSFAQKPEGIVADSNMIKTLFFAGLRDKLNEDYNKADEIFRKILAIDPRNAAVYYEVAVVNYKQNKLLEAEMAIKQALSLETDNTWYWMMMAEVYKRKGSMENMVGALNQLIRLSPDKPEYYFDRSNAYLLAGKVEEAMKGYDELEKKFGSSEALLRARRRASSSEAPGEEKKLVEQRSDDQQIILAEQLYQKGDLKGALALFKKVLESGEQPYKAWEQALNIQLMLKEFPDAIRTADAALSIYPNQAILYYFLAVAEFRERQVLTALTTVRTALDIDPENGIYLELYGDLLYLSGDKAAALIQWKKAKQTGNGSGKLNRKINEGKYLE